MKHRLFVGIFFFITAFALCSLHLIVGAASSTATAQHREAIPAAVLPSADQYPMRPAQIEDQHPKEKSHHESEKAPAKRQQLCKKLEQRRSELRTQEQEKQKKAIADSASASTQ